MSYIYWDAKVAIYSEIPKSSAFFVCKPLRFFCIYSMWKIWQLGKKFVTLPSIKKHSKTNSKNNETAKQTVRS